MGRQFTKYYAFLRLNLIKLNLEEMRKFLSKNCINQT